MLKKIRVEKAVGTILAHDLTRVVPGHFKGVAFKKGHRIREADIPELLKIGKAHIYVLGDTEGHIHENDAALRIASAVSGSHLTWDSPSEGKSSIRSACSGLLKVNVEGLRRINTIPDIMLATLKSHTPCQENEVVAATRIIPLLTRSEHIDRVEATATDHAPILAILPYRKVVFGGVVTGSEVYSGQIPDGFDDHVARKAIAFGCRYKGKILVPDDADRIAAAVNRLKDRGCDMVLITGGLSVDPDDVTVSGVRRTGARIIKYGSPVLPGAMFLYANLDGVVILGLPACVFYHRTTIFDLVLPRILSGDELDAEAIAGMGHGGLCRNCMECRFPACGFGT